MNNQIHQIHQIKIPQTTITNITAGAYHSIAHTQQSIWVWGKPNNNNLGTTITTNYQPIQLHLPNINNSSAGSKHTFVWSAQKVYGWGSNYYYELSMNQEKDYQVTLLDIFQEAVDAGIRIKQISCGNSHTLAVLEVVEGHDVDTQLYVWGQSKNYQLGLDTTAIIPYPVRVEFEEQIQIKSIYSRSDYNVIVSETGDCYSWGSNIFGRLGLLGTKHHRIPTQLNLFNKKIRQIGIGIYHCVAVTEQGQAYAWGHGMQGQLGINQILSEVGPTKVIFQSMITKVSCGQYHTVVVDQHNNVYTCGSNSYSALGHMNVDSRKRCKVFTKIDDSFEHKIIKIVSGDRHNMLLTQNGKAYSWGCNKFGQLGHSVPQQQKDQKPEQSQNKSMSFNSQQVSHEPKQTSICNSRKSLTIQINPNPSLVLMDWKQRYNKFKQQKQAQQKQLMAELQTILSSISM